MPRLYPFYCMCFYRSVTYHILRCLVYFLYYREYLRFAAKMQQYLVFLTRMWWSHQSTLSSIPNMMQIYPFLSHPPSHFTPSFHYFPHIKVSGILPITLFIVGIAIIVWDAQYKILPTASIISSYPPQPVMNPIILPIQRVHSKLMSICRQSSQIIVRINSIVFDLPHSFTAN